VIRTLKRQPLYLVRFAGAALAITAIVWFLWPVNAVQYARGTDPHTGLCRAQMGEIAAGLKAYASEHAGRLPARTKSKKSDDFSWVSEIEPYLRRPGIPSDDVLRCPLDDRRDPPSSYRLNPRMHGRLIRDVTVDEIVLEEDAPRHRGTALTLRGEVWKNAK
jgi:hypothetical protein